MNDETYYILTSNGELYHYGVKGMKWGVRKNVYDINAAYYNKRAEKLNARAQRNRTMASMNRDAANRSSGLISKANNINANYYQKKADKLTAKADRNRTMAVLNEQASKRKGEAAAARVSAKLTKKSIKEMTTSKQAFSGKAAAQRLLAKTFEINEKVYSKSNPTLASMNRDAKDQALSRAEQYQNEANAKKQR